MLPVEIRFMSHVGTGDESACWMWTGFRNKQGYGKFKLGGKMCLASRVAYELFCGDIPNGQCVCHSCDNPSCVRPDHLWLGTCKDNTADKMKKGRHHDNSGDKNGRAKLSSDDVRGIRVGLRDGVPIVALAAAYGVKKGAIYNIRNGKSWPLDRQKRK